MAGMNFKLNVCAASLLALAVFSGATMAQTADQPAAAAEQAAPAALPDDVLALLNDKRGAAELSEEDLRQRFKSARKALKADGLADDVRGQLQALVDADKAELENRKAAAEQQQQPAEAPKEQAPAAAETQPAQEQPVQEQPAQAAQPEAQPAQPAALPDNVLALLNDKRGASELSDDDLRQRFRAARKSMKMDGLPDDAKAALQALMDSDKAEIEGRKAAAEQQAKPEAKPEETPKEQVPAAAETQPVVPAQEPPKQEEPVPQVAAPAEPAAPIVTTEPAGAAAAAPPAPEPKQTDKAQVQTLDGNAGDPVAEQKAKVFLDDATPAKSLTDDALRARLDGIRDLLAENELSGETERALRKKLRDERDVLRARLADAKAAEDAKAFAAAQAQAEADRKKQVAAAPQQPAAAGQPEKPRDGRNRKTLNFNIIINAETPQREILRDRRPSDELAPEELRRRIQTYRDVQAERRYLDYDPGVREYWRQTMNRDRQVLRERLIEERSMRADEYRRRSNQNRVNLNDLAFADDEVPQDVFAAEVDDQEIEDVIVAPPRRKATKRYAVKDFASNRQLRESVSRVEVDTIHFGFNEAFVREEEVDNLDQVASVMEKVLRKYPREVFLIEGHTDAVGSDAYNNKLSKARAEAVKKTLSTYYLIPAKNLATVGLGERYLKIPTADPEPENRRVSISRVTAFVGQAPQ